VHHIEQKIVWKTLVLEKILGSCGWGSLYSEPHFTATEKRSVNLLPSHAGHPSRVCTSTVCALLVQVNSITLYLVTRNLASRQRQEERRREATDGTSLKPMLVLPLSLTAPWWRRSKVTIPRRRILPDFQARKEDDMVGNGPSSE